MVARLNGITQTVSSKLAIHKFATNVLAGLFRNTFVLQMITHTDTFNVRDTRRTTVKPKPSKRRACAPIPVEVLFSIAKVNVFDLLCYR